MRASKADKFYMGMLLAIICFCFGLLRIMDEADARRAAERETLIIAEPPTIVAPAFQPVQTVYFEPDPEPEEPAAEVFVFRENVPLSRNCRKSCGTPAKNTRSSTRWPWASLKRRAASTRRRSAMSAATA